MNSALARKLLSLYYKPGKIYQIPVDPLRGLRLRYAPSINFREMMGIQEKKPISLLRKVLTGSYFHEKRIICDVGAYIGSYTLWLAHQQPDSSVYAFEASPDNINRLQDHLRLNGFSNVEIVEMAITDPVGRLDFFISASPSQSSLYSGWASTHHSPRKINVETTTLDIFFEEKPADPDFIKIDIEGGGVFALKGCSRIASEKRPLFLIESHMPDEDRAISNLLIDYDYQAFRINDQHWVSKRTEIHPHPDRVWGTIFACPTEKKAHLASILG